MNDKTLIADLLAEAEEAEARQFGRKLYNSPVFSDLDRKSLMARVIKACPATQDLVTGEFEKKVEGVISSHKSIEKRKKDLETIIKIKIPENTKEIAVARSYGDLRENFEFKASKQMQAVLMRRKSQLEKELIHVQATDFTHADTSEVNIGTVVHLEDDGGQDRFLHDPRSMGLDSRREHCFLSFRYWNDPGPAPKKGTDWKCVTWIRRKNRFLTIKTIATYL